MANGGYDDGYSNCPCFWGKEPGSYVKLLFDMIRSFEGMRFLDAGCGEGKNAAFIAANGGFVDALEVSEVALRNRSALWGENALINWRSADIRSVDLPPEGYDVVVAYGLLHCMSSADEVAHVLRSLQRATRVGGYNIICAFNQRHQELDAHPGFTPTLVSHGMYTGAYEDGWQIIASTDSDLIETHPHNNIEHTHSMTRILARRTT